MSEPLPPREQSPSQSINSTELKRARSALRDAAAALQYVSSLHSATGRTAADRQHFNGAAAQESEHMIFLAVARAQSAAALFSNLEGALVRLERSLATLDLEFGPAYYTWIHNEDPREHLQAEKRLENIRDARVEIEESFAKELRELRPPEHGDLLDLALKATPGVRVQPTFDMSPTKFAKALQSLTPHEREKFAREHRQDIIKYVLDKGRDSGPTREISTWWKGLSPQERTEMMRTIPEFIGNANGIPYADRDLANRLMLIYLADGRRTPAPGQETAVKQFSEALAAQDRNVISDRGLKNQLISLDASGRLLAQAAIGDLDKATTFTFMEHGIATGTDRNPGSWFDTGGAFSANVVRAGNGKAVIVSFGYDAPDGPPHLDPGQPRFPIPIFDGRTVTDISPWAHGDFSVLRNEHAINGAPAMAARYDAARVFADLQHPQQKTRITVMAHSYGTRIQAYALTLVKHRVDAVYWAGSAGVPSGPGHQASDMKVGPQGGNPGDHIFAYTNADDWIARDTGIAGSQIFGFNRVLDPSSEAPPTTSMPQGVTADITRTPPKVTPGRSQLGNTVLANPKNPAGPDFSRTFPSHGHDASTQGGDQKYPGYFDPDSFSGKYSRWTFEGQEDKIRKYTRK